MAVWKCKKCGQHLSSECPIRGPNTPIPEREEDKEDYAFFLRHVTTESRNSECYAVLRSRGSPANITRAAGIIAKHPDWIEKFHCIHVDYEFISGTVCPVEEHLHVSRKRPAETEVPRDLPKRRPKLVVRDQRRTPDEIWRELNDLCMPVIFEPPLNMDDEWKGTTSVKFPPLEMVKHGLIKETLVYPHSEIFVRLLINCENEEKHHRFASPTGLGFTVGDIEDILDTLEKEQRPRTMYLGAQDTCHRFFEGFLSDEGKPHHFTVLYGS